MTADWEDELTLPVRQLVGNAVAAARANQVRVERLLEALGIAELLHAELSALSDGQRRRVQLFCKLLPERELVLLDEATNSLDVLSRTSLLAFLREESESRGCTVVFCTHIFDGLDGWATELAHLDGGVLRRHVSATSLPPGETLYQTVSGWLIDHAKETREQEAARGAPRLDAIAKALVDAATSGDASGLAPLALPLSSASAIVDEPAAKRNKQGSSEHAPTSTPKSSLPSGWDNRGTQMDEGAFGGHKWTAPKPPGVAETRAPLLEARGSAMQPTPPPPAVDLTDVPPTSDFIPAASFAGARPGYTFKTGPSGTGYYVEVASGGSPAGAPVGNGASAASAPSGWGASRHQPPSTAPPPSEPDKGSAPSPAGEAAPSPAASAAATSASAESKADPAAPVPQAEGLPPAAMRIAPHLQGALKLLAERVTACNTAVGKGDTPSAVAASAEIASIWTQAEAALKLFETAMGGGKGEVRLMPRPPELMSSASRPDAGSASTPWGFGASRHLPESALVAAGTILAQDPPGGKQ